MLRSHRSLLVAAGAAIALAGCGSAAKVGQNAADTSTSSSASGMNMSGSASGSGAVVGTSGSSGAMNMKSTTVVSPSGVATPVPIKTIGTGTWKDMAITAQEMTPVPFYVDEGTTFKEIKPTKQTSFHLMVMLTDKHTGVAIPYAKVWATISKNGKTVFNDLQWPMLSEYMGPHYGNDISLPGPGTYQLTLLVSAPEAAMHVEYANMWSGTHKVTSTFTWK